MFNIISHQGNLNQNHLETPPYTSKNGKNGQGKKQQMLERMWRKGIPLTLLVGMQVGTATLASYFFKLIVAGGNLIKLSLYVCFSAVFSFFNETAT